MEISVQTTVNAPMDTVWTAWITPDDIKQWNFASEDWSCPEASNNFDVGARFNYRMEARDGSMGFDFEGTYTVIDRHKMIEYKLDDDRKVKITFDQTEDGILVKETFTADESHPVDMQKQGWQSILNNFKDHVENK